MEECATDAMVEPTEEGAFAFGSLGRIAPSWWEPPEARLLNRGFPQMKRLIDFSIGLLRGVLSYGLIKKKP